MAAHGCGKRSTCIIRRAAMQTSGSRPGRPAPGPSHGAQLDAVIADLDPLTAAAAPMINSSLGGWFEQSLAERPVGRT